MQRNWIGKSEGLRLLFEAGADAKTAATSIEVFTTRPDTIFGASFVALSADHPLAAELAPHNPALAEFIAETPPAAAPPPKPSKRPRSSASSPVFT